MAQTETTTKRLPRGAGPVSKAFLTALESIPDATRSAVAKAAQTLIRDELKLRRERAKAVTAVEKARAPEGAKRPAKAAASKSDAVLAAAPIKRRGRKPADASAVA